MEMHCTNCCVAKKKRWIYPNVQDLMKYNQVTIPFPHPTRPDGIIVNYDWSMINT